MLLFLLLAIPLCLALLVGVVLVRLRGRILRLDALGTISERWLAEQRRCGGVRPASLKPSAPSSKPRLNRKITASAHRAASARNALDCR